MRLDAVGYRPALKFSWHQFDFGPSHVHQSGMPPKTHQLVIRNDDDKPFAIDCLFDPSSAPFLAVGETPTSLEPGKSASVEVEFSLETWARRARRFRSRSTGCTPSTSTCPARGPASRRARQSRGRVRELRKSPRGAIVRARDQNRQPGETPDGGATHGGVRRGAPRRRRRRRRRHGEATARRSPTQDGHDPARVRAQRRSRPFQVPLEVSLAGGAESFLSALRGSCVGVEVKLARDDVDFGAVTLGSRVTRTRPVAKHGRRGRHVRVRRASVRTRL